MTEDTTSAAARDGLLDMRAPLEIGVCVADLEAMADFYESAIGLKRMGEVDLGAETAERLKFNRGGFRMIRMQTPYGERIKLLKPLDGAGLNPAPPFVLGRAGIAYLTFIVGDLRKRLLHLRDSGVELLSGVEPLRTRPGTEIAFARDIEGNTLEFVEYGDIGAYRPDLFRR